jgi:hypothetical protein
MNLLASIYPIRNNGPWYLLKYTSKDLDVILPVHSGKSDNLHSISGVKISGQDYISAGRRNYWPEAR